jgi:hypothetical protein
LGGQILRNLQISIRDSSNTKDQNVSSYAFRATLHGWYFITEEGGFNKIVADEKVRLKEEQHRTELLEAFHETTAVRNTKQMEVFREQLGVFGEQISHFKNYKWLTGLSLLVSAIALLIAIFK